jgi:hypothetical protein
MKSYTSWGRTRRPKALNDGNPVSSKETAAAVTVVEAADLNASINDTAAGENGYSTENQRFLHVLVTGNNSKSVEIVGYNYAFGAWAPLQVRVDVDNAAAVYANAVATTGSSGEAKLYIFDIAGIDRIAFVSGDAPASTFAACSTF